MEMMKDSSYWWWFDSHQHSSKRSPWLQSALGDLDRKTKTMLKLIEEDADSFAQRAEMYYKKRPELINIVEDFYKTHRSLAERYDLLKSESANRLLTTLGSPFSAKYQQPKLMDQFDQAFDSHSETGIEYPFSTKYHQPKLPAGEDQFGQTYDIRSETGTRASGYPFSTKYQQANPMAGVDRFDQTYDSFSETGKRAPGYPFSTKYQPNPMGQNYDSFSETGTYELEDTAESEVDDPEHDEETVDQNDMGELEEPEHEVENKANEVVELVYNEGVKRLKEEIERLKEENRVQKEQMLQKDEEKREVIRQLSSAVEVLKAENEYLRKLGTRNSPKKKSIFEFEIFKDVFSGKIFNASARS